MMAEKVGEKGAQLASETLIEENAQETKTLARADLLGHLATLGSQADSSDLQFVCKDGVRVEACRFRLMRRSPVLDSMLTNGMLESNSSVINLPEIPAPALLAIVEFLYTGNIVDHQPKDWQTGLEIMSAANFFLLPVAEKIVEEFSNAQALSVGENLQQAAIMLSVALTFKCFSHEENAGLLYLLHLLQPNWMHSNHLSEEAVDFILRVTKSNLTENTFDISLEEYFCFRRVIVWCLYNSGFGCTEEINALVDAAIPIAKEKLYCRGEIDFSANSPDVKWLPKYNGDLAQDKILQALQSHGMFESATRLLERIDWFRMPPSLFLKIIEPMKLVPESTVISMFRFHYTHRQISMFLNVKWSHSRSYGVHKGGLLIKNNGTLNGSAICQLRNSAGEDYCSWRLSAGAYSYWCQLGFVFSENLGKLCRIWNFDRCCTDALLGGSNTTVLRVVELNASEPMQFKGHGGAVGSRDPYSGGSGARNLTFQYHRSTQSCAISVDGKDLGTIWSGLPTTNVFPVISFGSTCRPGAWAHLQIDSGFEIF